MESRMNVGIVGLGLLGRALAGRLLAEGHRVSGCDIAEAAREEALRIGVAVHADVRTVTGDADVVLLSLLTSEDRRALLWGEQHMAGTLGAGALVLDTTTARPEDTEADAKRLIGERGARLIDVCVVGSSEEASCGKALALVGDSEDQADYRPLLAAFTRSQYFFGAPGRGNRAKLIVNLVLGLHRLVLAEALGLARKEGFDLAQILDVLKDGGAYSTVMDTKGPKMLSGTYEPPAARLDQHAKDVGLIIEHARRMGARVPLSEVHRVIIDDLVAEGCGALDNAAIFKAFSGGAV